MSLSQRWRRVTGDPRCWLALALLGGFAVVCWGPLRFLLDGDYWLAHLQDPTAGDVAVFVLAQALLVVLSVPGTLLAIAGGVAFGLVWGTLWTAIGATLGALGAFLLSRYLLHDWALRQFGRHRAIARFRAAVRRYPLRFVVLVRLAPISPFCVVNYLFGLTPISWQHYTLGTGIGIIPGAIAFTWLGVAGEDVARGKGWSGMAIALAALLMLSVGPPLYRHWQQRRNRRRQLGR